MAGWATIEPQVLVILNTLTGSGQRLAAVYDYYTTNPTGYPCAMFMADSNENSMYTNAENLRTYNFKIYLIQEVQAVKGIQAAKNLLLPVVDDVIAAFDSDHTRLAGTVDYLKPAFGGFAESDWANGTVLIATINLSCVVEVAV